MNKFIEEIKVELEARVEEGVEVQFKDVVKNNDVVLKAVVIKKSDEFVAPTIYLDGFINKLEEGELTVKEVADKIMELKDEAGCNQFGDLMKNLNKEKVLESVVCQIVNKDENSKKLIDAPYKEVLDLAVIYRCVLSSDENGKASFVIGNSTMKMYGIDIDELHNAALKNMKDEGFEVRSMAEVLADMMGCDPEEMEGAGGGMYCLSNVSQVNGATIMLYEEYFAKLAEKVGDDLYILPSSIHEILAIKASDGDVEELRNMVREVNDTQVSEEERLSYNVYRYSREDRGLMVA